MSRANLNPNNPAVKRIMREMKDHLKSKSDEFKAGPVDDDNIFEWHFTITGPAGTDFEGGIYHGRIILPPQYPFKPPDILLLTPNGRFELKKKICLNVSNYHPEEWQPSWDIRTVLTAMRSFLATPGAGAIGSVDCPPAERKKLAKRSINWRCKDCDVSMREVFAHLRKNKPAKPSNSGGDEPAKPSSTSDEPVKPSSDDEHEEPSTGDEPSNSTNSSPPPSDSSTNSNSLSLSNKNSQSHDSKASELSHAHAADKPSSTLVANKTNSDQKEEPHASAFAAGNKPREPPNIAEDMHAAAAAHADRVEVPRGQAGLLGTQDDMLSAVTLALVFMILGIVARKIWFPDEF